MKNIILQIYSILTNIKFKILYTGYNVKKTIVFKLKITGIKNNRIESLNGCIKRSSLFFQGSQNSIRNYGYVSNLNIKVFGNNNTIELLENNQISHTNIYLRGNNCHISIGKNTTIGHSYILCMGSKNFIEIGEDCMFAEDIEIWNSDSHPISDTNGKIINPSKPIQIGNHVWLGKGCKILKGVNIGNNAVIGMNTIVTKNITSNSLNVGIPNKTIKENITWERKHIQI